MNFRPGDKVKFTEFGLTELSPKWVVKHNVTTKTVGIFIQKKVFGNKIYIYIDFPFCKHCMFSDQRALFGAAEPRGHPLTKIFKD